MSSEAELQATVDYLVQQGKGILAADESSPTIAKRLSSIGVDSTEEIRRQYRSLLLETPGLGDFISGIILFEETLEQNSSDNTPLPKLAERQGILPGIKVDKGKSTLPGTAGEEITRGLDGLEDRIARYKDLGARFAKWRAVYHISPTKPSRLAVDANAEVLARYAAVCQAQGIVPIVEPEVLIDGAHNIQRCAEATEAVLHAVFQALYRHRVTFEHIILKPNMVTPGKENISASPETVAEHTLTVFRRAVPAAVPGIAFLSGGQSPEEATANLNALNQKSNRPWELSFSFGRALQQPVLHAWQGKSENVVKAQTALYHRAKLNGAARFGNYSLEMEET